MADQPNPIDVEVGRRLKRRRTLLGISQERLGELLGVSYQQIQKYERGTNRIGSSRLYDICRILDVPAGYFLDDAPEPPVFAPPAPPAYGLAEAPAGFAFDAPVAPPAFSPEPAAADERETLELVRAFRRIRDPIVRRRLFELTKALAGLAYRAPDDPGPPGEDAGAA
jgi:transcriptional regulator with XRE-family HTH domain